MNRRIRKKRAALLVCMALDVPMMLDVTRPSFWQLPAARRRHLLACRITQTFRTRAAIARRAVTLVLG